MIPHAHFLFRTGVSPLATLMRRLLTGYEDLNALNRYPYCRHSAVMGKKKRPWQDVKDVLGYFGKTEKTAKKAYIEYVNAGIGQGRRDDLTGGGLVRSTGGRSEVKELR
jgi:putative transposase